MQIITITTIATPVGEMQAGCAEAGVCLLDYADSRYLEGDLALLSKSMQATIVRGSHRHLTALERQLGEYFAGSRQTFDLPLTLQGTAFQEKAWRALLSVPYGEVISYARQAALMGMPKAVRAAANANARNRITIVIPCHRIIGANGSLTGYGGGLKRKEWLLKLEAQHRAKQ